VAELPDPTESLTGEARAAFDAMAQARAHADGRAALGEVYVRMFNNPAVAVAVGNLGEHLRFHGVLPDDVRELVIIRYSAVQRLWYEWSHHQRPARLAGVTDEVIAAVTAGALPATLADSTRAALEVVDAVVAHGTIPGSVQERVVDAHGTAGIVEVVALCGLYALLGFVVTAFDIPIEAGFPTPPTPPEPGR
jgi:alkylhydroperoxidase family enzyme